MKTVRLEDWTLITAVDTGNINVLMGYIYEDEDHQDGTVIVSDEVLAVRDNAAVTRNTLYLLGMPSQAFIDWYKEQYGTDLDIEKPFLEG
jgi:hypothetical protein